MKHTHTKPLIGAASLHKNWYVIYSTESILKRLKVLKLVRIGIGWNRFKINYWSSPFCLDTDVRTKRSAALFGLSGLVWASKNTWGGI